MNENSKAWRNVILIFGAVLIFLLWFRRGKPANVANALDVPTTSNPVFTPTYLNWNQSPIDDTQFPPLLVFKPVVFKTAPVDLRLPRGYPNPKAPAPACGCGSHPKLGGPRTEPKNIAVFGSSDDLANYYTHGGGRIIAQAWASNLPEVI